MLGWPDQREALDQFITAAHHAYAQPTPSSSYSPAVEVDIPVLGKLADTRVLGKVAHDSKAKVAASPLFHWPTRGRNFHITAAISGTPQKRDKMRKGYHTPAFSGAHKRAELLRKHYILGGPQQRRQNQKWLPHPCLLGGPKKGGIAT